MSLPSRPLARAWILIPICALGFIAWCDYLRVQRVEFVSGVAQEGAAADPKSPTGYADGKRWLIVPEHNNPTYQWIEDTQLMAASGGWRVRRNDYENAPFGREVHSASPYRWWLLAVAEVDRAVSGRPLGQSLERAALFADPLLHLLLVLAATVVVARRFGAFSAALVAVALASVYPLAAAFLPGVANDFALLQIALFWGILLLLAGATAGAGAMRWFFLAGVAGGCGMWLNASETIPVVIGIGAGAVLASWVGGRGKPGAPANVAPWRAWAFGGAVTSLFGYLVEYFPNHMDPQLRVNYPLYGVAWLGLGELLWRFASWVQLGRPLRPARAIAACVLAAAALAALPVAIARTQDRAFLAGDLQSTRLTNLPDGVVASSFGAWAAQPGSAGAIAATLVSLLLVVPAIWLLFRNRASQPQRFALCIALGPVFVLLVLAVGKIRWWNTVDVALLGLLAVAASTVFTRARWVGVALLGAAVACGIPELAPLANDRSGDFKFTRAEVEGLYERALSQWIADRAGPGGATVLTPPIRTSSFCFYGGLRGLGTPNWENRDGLLAIYQIINSTRPDETLARINERGVTHIIVPSWDTDLDNLAFMGLKQPKESFIYALHQTDGGIFSWLRALPYSQPAISGFTEQSVLVLEVTDETDPATLRCRLVEYLIEMHQIPQAAASSQALLRYPADLGAIVALAEVAKVTGDAEGFDKDFNSVVSNLSVGANRGMAWDRRVSLATVLTLGGREDLGRAQVERCLANIDATRVRSLSTGSLYHFLVLLKHFGLEIPDPTQRALSLKLLPAELRDRL